MKRQKHSDEEPKKGNVKHNKTTPPKSRNTEIQGD